MLAALRFGLAATSLLVAAWTTTAARADDWISYDRSGGITGWSFKAVVGTEGSVRVAGTHQPVGTELRRPLEAEELAELRRLVEAAAAKPAGKDGAAAGRIADGLRRLVKVHEPSGSTVLDLSDGRRLGTTGLELVAALEALAERSPVVDAAVPQEGGDSASPIDLVLLAPPERSPTAETALLLELPIGRAHEPAECGGALELLLSIVLGPQAGVLLDGEPPVVDPDTGAWSLSVTPARTRLVVELRPESAAAARGAIARLRDVLESALPAVQALDEEALDHQRRRLATAVHDAGGDLRTSRSAALRVAAWGELADSPRAFGVHSVTRPVLLGLAHSLESAHARLLIAGPLAHRLAPLVSRGHPVRARGPIAAPEAKPAPRAGAGRNEWLASAPAGGEAVGLPAAIALEIAQRRHAAAWTERVEPGNPRRPVNGDTLAVVAPASTAERGRDGRRLRRTLEQLSTSLGPAAVDARLRRRSLGGEPTGAVARLRAAADLLELGGRHPGSGELVLEELAARESATVAEVRAAAAALADGLRELEEPRPGAARDAAAARLLERARGALFGDLAPEHARRAVLERRGQGPDGRERRLRLELRPSLPLRVEGEGTPWEVSAAHLPAGDSASSRREQALVREALADPAVLVAGAAAGLLPARESGTETLEIEGRRRTLPVLEVLVPARGAYRLLLDPDSGDPRAIEHSTGPGRTRRLLLSDIRQDERGHRLATRQELEAADGRRETLLKDVRVELTPP